MIPYADLDRAIARWKARQAGESPAAMPMEEAPSETSSGLIPLGDDADIEESQDL